MRRAVLRSGARRTACISSSTRRPPRRHRPSRCARASRGGASQFSHRLHRSGIGWARNRRTHMPSRHIRVPSEIPPKCKPQRLEKEQCVAEAATIAGLDAARKRGRIGQRRSKLKPNQHDEIVAMVSKGAKLPPMPQGFSMCFRTSIPSSMPPGSRPTNPKSPMSPRSTAPSFTPKQGQYLAFIYAYTHVLGRPPAEADLQRHFGVSPPSVHQMVLTLERTRLIRRKPGVARSIEVLVAPELLPVLR